MPNIKKNAWEYLDTETTKIPEEVRNALDPRVLDEYLSAHADELSDIEKDYLAHMSESRRKIVEKIAKVQTDVAQGKYEDTRTESFVDENGGVYHLIGLSQPSFQTADNGCWSCFYNLALQSRGVNELSQEDIRAFRPYKEKEKDGRRFGDAEDKEMNSDTKRNMMEMGDLVTGVLPDTMIKSTEIYSYRQYKGGKGGSEEEKLEYSAAAIEGIKKQIIEAIKVHKSPVGLFMDGHYTTITGIEGDTVYYKNSMPSLEGGEDPDMTYSKPLSTLLENALNGVNATSVMITWLEDIKLSKEGNIIYNTALPGVKADGQGKVSVEAKETQAMFADHRTQDGIIIGSTGGVDIPDDDAKYRMHLEDGFFRVDRTYLPKKLNMTSLRKKAENRSNEEENELKAARDKKIQTETEYRREVDILKSRGIQPINEYSLFNAPDDEDEEELENKEDRFNLTVDYTGKPFYGGGNFVDFKDMMDAGGWDKKNYENLLTAFANIYDVFIKKDSKGKCAPDDPQKLAVDEVYYDHLLKNEFPATVTGLRIKLEQFTQVMGNGATWVNSDRQQRKLIGLNGKAPHDLWVGMSIAYIKAYIQALKLIEKKAPNMDPGLLNIDRFINKECRVREDLINSDELIAQHTEKMDFAYEGIGVPGQGVPVPGAPVPGAVETGAAASGSVGQGAPVQQDANAPKQQAIYDGNNVIGQEAPLGSGSFADNKGRILELAEGVSINGYGDFLGILENKGYPFDYSDAEGNVLRAVYNLVTKESGPYAEKYSEIFSKVNKVDIPTLQKLLFSFHDIKHTIPLENKDLRDSLKCVDDWLEEREKVVFKPLLEAYNNLDAKTFATEFITWRYNNLYSMDVREYERFYSTQVMNEFMRIREEFSKVTPEDGDKFLFYSEVYREMAEMSGFFKEKINLGKEAAFLRESINNSASYERPPHVYIKRNEEWKAYVSGEAAITKINAMKTEAQLRDVRYMDAIFGEVSDAVKNNVETELFSTLSDEEISNYVLGGAVEKMHAEAKTWIEKNGVLLSYNENTKLVTMDISPEFGKDLDLPEIEVPVQQVKEPEKEQVKEPEKEPENIGEEGPKDNKEEEPEKNQKKESEIIQEEKPEDNQEKELEDNQEEELENNNEKEPENEQVKEAVNVQEKEQDKEQEEEFVNVQQDEPGNDQEKDAENVQNEEQEKEEEPENEQKEEPEKEQEIEQEIVIGKEPEKEQENVIEKEQEKQPEIIEDEFKEELKNDEEPKQEENPGNEEFKNEELKNEEPKNEELGKEENIEGPGVKKEEEENKKEEEENKKEEEKEEKEENQSEKSDNNSYEQDNEDEIENGDQHFEDAEEDAEYHDPQINDTTKKSFDNYIRLHTKPDAPAMGNFKEKVICAAKCIAALKLQAEGRDFNRKDIHREVEKVAKDYCLTHLPEDAIDKILSSRKNATIFAKKGQDKIYGVEENRWEEYIEQMEKVHFSMLKKDGRSDEYGKLYDAVKKLANIDVKWDKNAKEAIMAGNKALMEAIEDYTKGKKKVRVRDYGKLAFEHTMDAMALLSRNTGGILKYRIKTQVDRINHVRGVEKNPKSPDYIDLKKFGGDNAEQRTDAYYDRHPDKKPKDRASIGSNQSGRTSDVSLLD